MPARGVIQSPVLVGRDAFLALVERRLADAAAGSGQLLFVAGEAGIGKTRLLGAIARHAHASGFAVVRAAAFPGDVQSFAGLLLDLASDLVPARDPALSALGRSLTSRVRAISADAGDAHHRRRLLVQDLADLLVTVDPGTPVLIVLEDLHWADELSLDVLGHLAGRLAARPMLVAGAYRSDELYPALPMRELRARLLGQRLAEEFRLPRLGLAQTATVASAVLGRPAPAQVVAAIHERSDGIPLHVEELLAAIDEDALTPQSGAAVQSAAVPDTLGDAVLSRARQLATRTREVASAAAVIGRSFDFDLLTAITGAGPDEVAGALRELQDAYFVLPGSDAVSFDFRHALIRDALYADTDLPVRRRLHERVARAAAERGYRGAFISAHFEQAGCPGPAYEYAAAAAGEAASMSAHGEALELYRRAVRNLPAGLAALDRAALFAALGDEAAATDDNAAAAEAYRAAHELAAGAGDVRAAAALAPRMAAVAHLLGEGLDARVGTLQAALDDLDGVADADRERARLRSAMAAAYLLDDRLDEAITHGELSRAESQRIGDDEAALNAAATLGTVLVFTGRMDEGWQLLEDAIARARGTQQEAEAARGYRLIGSAASELVEYDRGERWLADGIRYAEQAELWNHRHFMASHLAHVQWATGQWDAATQTAQQALADGRGGITTRITAQYVLGFLAMGRGDWEAADTLLREALAQGEQMAELNRLSPPLWGLAEAARCQGDYGTALTLCERGYQASADGHGRCLPFPVPAYRRAGLPGAWRHCCRRELVGPGRRGAYRPRHPRHTARDHSRPGTGPARAWRAFRSPPGAGVGVRGVAGPAALLGRHLGPAGPRRGRRPGTAPRRGGRLHGRSPHHRSHGRCRHGRRCRRPAHRPIRPCAAGRAVAPAERTRIRGRPACRGRPHQPADRASSWCSRPRPSRRTSRISSRSWAPHAAPRSRHGARPSGRPPTSANDQPRIMCNHRRSRSVIERAGRGPK